MHSQLDKIVANQLLDAAKSVLEYISHWMMELNQGNAQPPNGLSQTYGRIRRLRDYLQRSVAAYGRSITLDLAEDDRNLLASCIVHHLADIDREIEAGAGDRDWLEEKRRNLAQSAVALATRPVSRIPTRSAQTRVTTTVRSVTAAVAQKTVQLPGESVHGQGVLGSGTWGAMAPQAPPADPHADGSHAPTPTGGGHGAHHGGPVAPPPEASYDAGFGMGGGFHAPGGEGAYGEPAYPTAAAPQQPVPAPAGRPMAPSGPATPPPGSPMAGSLGAAHQNEEVMLDPSRVSDPRLRAMATMDLRAFDRTMREEDYRLAMVHLSSVFEGVIVDYSIPRQRELELRGTPETWRLDQLVERILGGLSSMDRPYLLQFTMARQLIRPAVQLHSPMVVTRSSLSKAIDFCRRVLAELGYAGNSGRSGTEAQDQGWGAPPSGVQPAAPASPAPPQPGGPVAPGASPSPGWDVPGPPFS